MTPYHPTILVVTVLLVLLAGCGADRDPLAAFERGDYETARELWIPLAGSGDAEAQNYLGLMYYMGLGVRRDYEVAVDWFEQAARQGHPDAQRNTGIMYQYGHGLAQHDFNRAYLWFFAASRQGNELALAHVNWMATKLTPNQQMRARQLAGPYIIHPVGDPPGSPVDFRGLIMSIEDHQGE